MAAQVVDVPRGVIVPGLREARRAAVLTQEQLATKAGVSVATVSDLERGQPAAIPTVQKLAQALGVTPRELTQPPPAD